MSTPTIAGKKIANEYMAEPISTFRNTMDNGASACCTDEVNANPGAIAVVKSFTSMNNLPRAYRDKPINPQPTSSVSTFTPSHR